MKGTGKVWVCPHCRKTLAFDEKGFGPSFKEAARNAKLHRVIRDNGEVGFENCPSKIYLRQIPSNADAVPATPPPLPNVPLARQRVIKLAVERAICTCLGCCTPFVTVDRLNAHGKECEKPGRPYWKLVVEANYREMERRMAPAPATRNRRVQPRAPTAPASAPVPATVHRLPFELLPPGRGHLGLVEHFRLAERKRPSAFKGGIDEERLKFFSGLDPEVWIGTEGWSRYVVLTFDNTSHVVLECPVPGNAIYILDGDWNDAARLSKRDIVKSPAFLKRVCHRGDWQEKIRAVLWKWHRYTTAFSPQ